MIMDAFELLKTDHKKVADIFSAIESASGQAKKRLFTRLKSELDLHAHIEEKFLYPALENKQPARDLTLEAYEEHKIVKELLGELASYGAPDDEWDAKLKVLKENVEHHVEEEEGELFDKAEDVLSEEQIEQLGNKMEAEKARKGGGVSKRVDASQRQSQSAKSQSAKSRGGKKQESEGVLKKLANLVGLGGGAAAKKKPAKTKAARTSAAKKSSKKAVGKTKAAGKAKPKASAKRAPAKKGGRRVAGTKNAKGPAQSQRGR